MKSLFSSLIFFSFALILFLFFTPSFAQDSSSNSNAEKITPQNFDSASVNIFQNIKEPRGSLEIIPLPPPLELQKIPGMDWKKEKWDKVKEWEKFNPFV
jgi:hypothetical protein